jgi:hypothetical protein
MGLPANALLAAGAAMMGGRNPQEGLANAGQAFVTQANQDRTFQANRADRAEARADRRTTNAQTEAYRRAQLAIAQQRANQAGTRTNGQNPGEVTRGQPIPLVDPQGRQFTRITFANGATQTRGPDGQVVTDQAVLESLMRPQESGLGRTAGQVGVDNQETAQGIVAAGEAARPTLQTLQRIRTGITTEGGMGPDLLSQTQRFLADRLRLPTGTVTPQGLALNRQQIDSFVSTVLPDLVKELRPVSNIDAETVRRALLSVNTEQEAMRVMLDVFEAPLRRQARMADDWLALEPAARTRIVTGGPQRVSAWQAERRRVYDEEGFAPPVQITPREGGGFRPMRPGERRDAGNGITIERVN